VTVDTTIDPSALRAAVHSAEADVLGGRVSADPFQYDPASDHLIVGVNLKSIQLPLILSMADFESIEIDGQVSGHIPVELKDDKLTISGGKISADQPGGSIRYQGGDGNMGNASLGVASAALSNFVFDSLTSNVAYDDVGNLVLAMRMEGTNPDLDPLQPVILNLNVENNIPQLLRSLQATRSIQEILERKAGIQQ
jgi:hypothetical protein